MKSEGPDLKGRILSATLPILIIIGSLVVLLYFLFAVADGPVETQQSALACVTTQTATPTPQWSPGPYATMGIVFAAPGHAYETVAPVSAQYEAKGLYFRYSALCPTLWYYGSYLHDFYDQDTLVQYNGSSTAYFDGYWSDGGSWVTSPEHVQVTGPGVYDLYMTYNDGTVPPWQWNYPGFTNDTPGGTETFHVKNTMFDVSISPDVQYLAVGKTKELTASVNPAVNGTYSWTTNLGPGTVKFYYGPDDYRDTATGATVTIIGRQPSSGLNTTDIKVKFTTETDMLGRVAEPEYREAFTVFTVDISGETEQSVNWNDDGPHNEHSDRRDSGVLTGSSKEPSTDFDIQELVVSIMPSAIQTGTTLFSQSNENDRGAIWETNNRSGDRLTGGKTFNNSDPSKKLYLEAIYPNSLDADGNYTGAVTLTLECTLDGSKSEFTKDIHQYLNANCTFYTLPHEVDKGYDNETAVTESLYIGPTGDTHVNHPIKPTFKADSINAGTGLVANAPAGYPGYVYLKYQAEPERLYVVLTHTGAYGDMTNDAVAKARWTNGALSAFERNTDVDIPELSEKADALADDNRDYNLHWIIPYIGENREVLDSGGGGGKWLDVFVHYVSWENRSANCQTLTMRRCLEELGAVDAVRATWR